MIIRIIGFLRKLGSLILSPFLKLRVFLQISVVILVMIGFIVVEGFNSIKVIDKMRDVSVQVFNDSVRGFDVVYSLKNELQETKISYLKALAGGDKNISINFSNQDYNISFLKRIDPDEAESISTELAKIGKILQEPVSRKNFEKMNRSMIFILTRVQGLESLVRNTATQSLTIGKEYSQYSKNNTYTILIFALIISLGLGLTIASSISKPLKTMANTANSLATGDLSCNVNTRGCYEATVTVKGLNHALVGLRALIEGINKESEMLLAASKDLRDASLESGRAAAEVARAMEELAEASSEQTNQINQTAVTINELTGLVKKVSTDTSNIALVSEKMAESAQVGQKVTSDVTQEINELYLSTKEVAQVIEELKLTSGKISEITAVIGGIAEQTTLLALNASIEAARAGSQGKGFSIVAKETGKLAEQSKQSAQMIADLISQMNVKTANAVDVIQKGMARVEAGKSLANEAAITFEGIFRELRDVLSQINTVAVSAQRMAEKSEIVLNAISTVASISEESMASTEEVSATTEQQSAAAQEVSSLAENLAATANKLKGSIAAFKINSDQAKPA